MIRRLGILAALPAAVVLDVLGIRRVTASSPSDPVRPDTIAP